MFCFDTVRTVDLKIIMNRIKAKKAISNLKAEMPYIGFKSVFSGLMIKGSKWVHIQLLYPKT